MDLEQQIKHKERMEKVVISSFQIIYLLSSPTPSSIIFQ